MAQFCICKAIANLPVNLLTSDIVNAGVEEGDLGLLDCLPMEYMTTDNIRRIILKNKNSWQSFSLSRFPMEKRSQDVCDIAVDKAIDNLPDVPPAKRNTGMLMKLMSQLKGHLNYLSLIPPACWTREAVYKGIRNLSSSNSSYNYGRHKRYSYSSSEYETKEALAKIQILLSCVPKSVRNKRFYFGLLAEISVEVAVQLIPAKYKQGKYFDLLAVIKPEMVPAAKYTRALFLAVLSPESSHTIHSFSRNGDIYKKLMELMDDTVADTILVKSPDYLFELPEKYQTAPRLLAALDKVGDISCIYHFTESIPENLLTKAVCKKLVEKTTSYPKFPGKIWDEAFVNFCLKHTTGYHWFNQIPHKFQTQEMVIAAIGYSSSNVAYANPQLITEEIACKLNQEANVNDYNEKYREYIPKAYFDNFETLTGLPKEFMGGECSFFSFRENKSNYTYCTLEHVCLAFYKVGSYNGYTRLIMTQGTPMSVRPETVFDKPIGTYHKTWLEKMVADYGKSFMKPTVGKDLKKYQTNGYYSVKYLETIAGAKVYANLFLDYPVEYITEINGELYIENTREAIVKVLSTAQS